MPNFRASSDFDDGALTNLRAPRIELSITARSWL
jgi:hypothetical protein